MSARTDRVLSVLADALVAAVWFVDRKHAEWTHSLTDDHS